jgi:hypothetical protein
MSKKPPPEVADAFARGDFAGVADWVAKEGDFARLMTHPAPPAQPRPASTQPPPRQREIDALQRLLDYRSVSDWLLAAIAALFLAFAIGVVTWRYGEVRFGPRYDFLSLLGVLLLSYWGVLAARRLWSRR